MPTRAMRGGTARCPRCPVPRLVCDPLLAEGSGGGNGAVSALHFRGIVPVVGLLEWVWGGGGALTLLT